MYSNIITGPRALVALGVFFCLATGCANSKKTDAVRGPETRVNQAAHTQIPTETVDLAGPLLDRIQELERELANTKRDNAWETAERVKLQTNCGEGFKGDGSSRFQVSAASSPEGAIKAVNEIYNAEGIEPHTETKPVIKTVNFGEHYPDIVCFAFKSGGQACFDPMEITER